MSVSADFLGLLRGQGSWHGLEVHSGGVIAENEQITLADALRRAGMDYELELVTPTFVTRDGQQVMAKGRAGILRPPTHRDPKWRVLGVKSNSRYNLLQNIMVAQIFEPINQIWPVESIGAVKHGGQVWFEFKQEPYDVAGDMHLPYLFIGNVVDGAVRFGGVNTRVVCDNTFALAISEGTLERIGHHLATEDALTLRRNVIQAGHKARQDTQAMLEFFTKKRVEDVDAGRLAEILFPNPSKPAALRELERARTIHTDDAAIEKNYSDLFAKGERAQVLFDNAQAQAARVREELVGNFFKFAHPTATGTAYAFFNALTEMTTHSDLFRGQPVQRMARNMFGSNLALVARATEELRKL